jgi:hypothetical protein
MGRLTAASPSTRRSSFEEPVPAYIKAGARWRQQTRRNEMHPWTGSYVGPDGVMGVNRPRDQ